MITRGIHEWTVPATGSYRIRAVGAAGRTQLSYNRGRDESLNTTLTQGEVIRILVGQQSSSVHFGCGDGSYGITTLTYNGATGATGDGNGSVIITRIV